MADKNGLGQGIQNLMFFLSDLKNPVTIAVHVISSLLVILFIIYYFWKPTDAFIKKQKSKLDKVHNQLATATRETEEALKNLKVKQDELKITEQKMLLEQKQKTEKILSEKIEEAERIKRSIIDDGIIKAKLIEKTAKETVKGEVIRLSISLTEKLIGASIDKKIEKKVIDSYLENINKAFKPKKNESSSKGKEKKH